MSDNFVFKDGAGATQVRRAKNDGVGFIGVDTLAGDDANPILGTTVDAAWDGVAASPTWTAILKFLGIKLSSLARSGAGSTGVDWSVGAPAIPTVGNNFGGVGPYANYVLVKTVPANTNRANIDVENLSGGQIVVVRDDGTAAGGTAPANASVFAIGAGAGAGQQGGYWSSQTFRGRLQIYAPVAGVQITVMED